MNAEKVDVEIRFMPDDGPMQTLYTVLTREEFDLAVQQTNDADAENLFCIVEARTSKDGPLFKRLFRASRVTFLEAK